MQGTGRWKAVAVFVRSAAAEKALPEEAPHKAGRYCRLVNKHAAMTARYAHLSADPLRAAIACTWARR